MLLKLYLMKGIKKCVKAAVFDFRENSLHAQKCVMGHFWAQITSSIFSKPVHMVFLKLYLMTGINE